MKEKHLHYFNGFKVGDMTDKGKIEDLFFLTFMRDGIQGGQRDYEPKGKGLLMATVNGKDIVIGNLKKSEP